MLFKWFISGFGLSLILSSLFLDSFASGRPSAADQRSSLIRETRICGLDTENLDLCLDPKRSPKITDEYLKGSLAMERLASALAERGGQVQFVSSPLLKCRPSEDLLRFHPESVGIQFAVVQALERHTVAELAFKNVQIETLPADYLEQGVLSPVEARGETLILRAGLGSCSTLGRMPHLGYELSRRLFRP